MTPGVAAAVRADDGGCVGPRAGFPGPCEGPIELDHVWTEGLGRRGPSVPGNLVSLCRGHHRHKTEHARASREALARAVPRLDDPGETPRSGPGTMPDPGARTERPDPG